MNATIGAISTTIKANTAVNVFRVFGGESKAAGFSFTPINPNKVANFRNAAGLPSGNTGNFLLEGTAKNKNILQQRSALPLDGNKGGLKEFIIDPKNVKVNKITEVKPPF